MWQSSNPALANDDAFDQYYGKDMYAEKANVATVQGVVNKTGILCIVAVIAGAGGFKLVGSFPSITWISAIAAFIVSLGVYFVLAGKPKLAPVLAPVYAVVEGVFLGALTGALERMLAGMDIAVPGGIALQAFIITFSIMFAMLILYRTGILRATPMFTKVVGTLAVGVMITYGLSFLLAMFGMQLPFVSLGSALQGGTAAWIGLGINVLILGVASLFLIIDFQMVEQRVASGAPKSMEWFCGFALLVTLAWIYFEAVKLVFRLAMLLNRE